MSFEALLATLGVHVESRGIDVRRRVMDLEKPAEFDGLSITLNPAHDAESLAYYLIHSYGSIVGWCADLDGVSAVFSELREAKCVRQRDPERLERALAPFRAFEVRASEYAVWVLDQVGAAGVVAAYSTFFRADLEAITIFHRTGRAPVWRPFLARWKASMDCAPFTPRPVPVFRPVPIERQEVKQQIEKGGPGRPALELNEQSR